ncbi:ATP-grasp domain-containing protein [Bdellovibrio sp. HCB337]|uniref:ATP-grasp domain-containing protein n=1 Tax=Bdellovibrio sp. HCB337 TaxID=3394358 RepID=UPI0039A46A60
MNFLILSRLSNLYSTQRLVQAIQGRGHHVAIENPESLCEGHSVDILIPRLGGFRYEESLTNLRQLEKKLSPKKTLNTAANFHQARHKKISAQVLADIPQPRAFETPDCFPVIVKDCLSSQGEGVFLCRSQEELQNCLYKLQGRELLFQEFISESQGHDIRVFIIGDKVAAAMERVAADPRTEFRSNLSLGGIAHPVSLTAEEEQLCIQAVRKLQLDYAGVDLVRSHRGPLILEVNPCPGLEGIEKCSHKNIAEEIVVYAESFLNSHS